HAGAEGAAAAMIALHHRVVTGEGQHVDVSAQQCVVWTLMDCTQTWDLNRLNVRRAGNIHKEPQPPSTRPHHWPCEGGQVSYTNYGGPIFAKTSERLYRLIGEVDGVNVDKLMSKEWLKKGGDKALVTQQDLDDEVEVLGPFFLRHTKEELYRWALERRFMLTPVNTPGDLLEDRQLKAREYLMQVEHPELEEQVPYPGAFVRLSETPCQVRRRPPRVGEHNEEIYIGELGLCREELAELRTASVI
ncbi:MAG: CoA transferase, partial [Dehalococcoidia bacterium]